MNPIGLTLPLQIGRNGYFEQSYDTLTQVKANITNLLRTKKGERRMNPNFGSGLQEYLFEQNLQDSPDIVKQIITDEINNYVPGVTVNKIDIGISNQEKNELTDNLAEKCSAEVAGRIGHVAILYRQNEDKEKRKIKIKV